jgi:Zn-dependent protease with chaperone function
VKQRVRALFTRPWSVFALCRAQELEADRFAASLGAGFSLASALARMETKPSPLYPDVSERIQRLVI